MGLRPVVEIMFFPFITLASDMLVNHAGKLRYMSGGKSSFPLTVRVKAGVGFGAGSQHSQPGSVDSPHSGSENRLAVNCRGCQGTSSQRYF
jgi:pyruvate/2-oxoglutarate/acetoin dehydrogenase E1 component